MKIAIKDATSNKNINIKLPMCIITTIVKFGIFPTHYNIDIDDKEKENIGNLVAKNILTHIDKKRLIEGLRYLKKHHKGLVLVDVEDPRGDKVKIEI